jgi:hypothetical protein
MNRARRGLDLRVEAACTGCFSGDHRVVKLSGTTSGWVVMIGWRLPAGQPTPELHRCEVAAEACEAFVAGVRATLARVNRPAPGRSTTGYMARVDWGDAEASWSIEATSRGLPRVELLALASDPLVAEQLRVNVQAALDVGIHDWAHELHRLVEEFVLEHESTTPARHESTDR